METLVETPSEAQGKAARPVKLRARASRPPLFTQLSDPFGAFGKSPSVLSFTCCASPTISGGWPKLGRTESMRRNCGRNVALSGTEPYSVSYVQQAPLLPTPGSGSQLYRSGNAPAGTASVAATPDGITSYSEAQLLRWATEAPASASSMKSAFKFPPILSNFSDNDNDMHSQPRRASLLANAADDFGGAPSTAALAAAAAAAVIGDRSRAHNNASYDGMATTAGGGCASVHYHCAPPVAASAGAAGGGATVSSATGRGSGTELLSPTKNTAFFLAPGASMTALPPHKTSMDSANTPQVTPPTSAAPAPTKCRRKAVITVDAMTTEILIASDSVCRLFGLRDRSLIGKRLAQVFALERGSAHIRRLSSGVEVCDERDRLDGCREGRPGVPIIFGDDFLFDKATHTLKPVYGKAMILRSPSVSMGFNSGSKPNSDVGETRSSGFCGETISSKYNTPKLPYNGVTSVTNLQDSKSLSSGQPRGSPLLNSAIKSTNNNNTNNKNSNNFYDNNTYLNLLFHQQQKQQQLQTQADKRQQQQQQQPQLQEQQQQKSILKVLHEEQRSIDDCKKDGCSEESTDQKKPISQRTPVASYDLQRGSSCCASTSAIPVPSTNSGRRSKPQLQQQQQQNNNKMVESRLYQSQQQQQQKPAPRSNASDRDAPNSNAYDDFEKRAENRIIIKNGFKRTTVRLPQPEMAAMPAATVKTEVAHSANGIEQTSEISSSGNTAEDDDDRKNAKCHQKQSGVVRITGAAANGRASDTTAGETLSDESSLNRRWLLLMEPINALHIAVLLGAKGRIFRMDDPLATILGYESTNRLFGTEISRLIPKLKIGAEWDGVTQYCCGKTTHLNGVPFTAILQCDFDTDCNAHSYDLRIRSISSINGVITITDSGMLYSYNVNFLQELFGHQMPINQGEEKMDIKDLIPDFYKYQLNNQNLASSSQTSPASEIESNASNAKFALNFDDDDDDDGVEEDVCSEPEASEEERQERCPLTGDVTSGRGKSKSDHLLAHRGGGGTANSLQAKHAYDRQRSSSSGCSDAPSTSNGICAGANASCKKQQKQKMKRSNNANNVNNKPTQEITPGIYYGLVKHADSSLIPVKIEISEVSMPSQPRMFNVGIGFDRSNDFGISQLMDGDLSDSSQALNSDDSGVAARKSSDTVPPVAASQLHKNKHPAYMAAIASTSQLPNDILDTTHSAAADGLIGKGAAKFSIGTGFASLRECDSDSNIDVLCPKTGSDLEFSPETHGISVHALENKSNDAVRGEYSRHYDTFQLIGNGAFGSVKLAARKNTGYLAVAKFVCKSKVLPESWVQSPKRGNRMVPIEVHLLENLQHANIVKVLDVFENDKYYQLVMEKLGCGMDLFELIEFQPLLDEPLTSYIFRQIVSAVDYLHENHIVHRDLKDENVIVDQNFCCKLIDFGSAAYFGDNIVFSTFCGTMEYCSPEVLTGNKYLGPELEMWSLGILLYTLVFFENPFRNPQETVQAEFDIPWEITEGLYQVLNWLLLPDPRRRATVGEIKRHWWVTQRVDVSNYHFQDVIKNYDQSQLMSPKYMSQLSAQNSVRSLSGLSMVQNSAGYVPHPDAVNGSVEHSCETDENIGGGVAEKKGSSTATSTAGTESPATVSPVTTPVAFDPVNTTAENSLFTLNPIDSDPTIVGSAPRDATTAH